MPSLSIRFNPKVGPLRYYGANATGPRAVFRRAVLAASLLVLLVGIVTAGTNIEILNLRLPLFVEIAKVRMSRQIETFVQKTALEENEFVTLGNRLIDKIVFGFGIKRIGAEAGAWIDDCADGPFLGRLTGFQVLTNLQRRCPIGILCGSGREWIKEIAKVKRRFATAVLIGDRDFDWFTDRGFRSEGSIVRPNPCALCQNHIFMSDLGTITHSGGLFVGRLSLLSGGGSLICCRLCEFGVGLDKLAGLPRRIFHFVELIVENRSLPENSDRRGDDEGQRRTLKPLIASILAAFFAAVGIALICQSTINSRDRVGYALVLAILAWPVFFISAWFFLSGVLGWNNGIGAW